MIDWSARARAHLAHQHTSDTDKTDETWLLSVSSPLSGASSPERECLSSVSSVAAPVVVTIGMEGTGSNDATAANDPSAGTTAPPVRRSANPYMTPEQGDECHGCGWDAAEIAVFVGRAAKFAQMGRTDPEHLAERLTLRDRQRDDRRMCLECRELEFTGRCAAARRGEIQGADRCLEPVPNILMRCPAFKGAVSAHRFNEGQ